MRRSRIALADIAVAARAKGASELFQQLGIHEMHIKAMALAMDWHWVEGDKAAAIAAAQRLLSDADADADLDARNRAARVVRRRLADP